MRTQGYASLRQTRRLGKFIPHCGACIFAEEWARPFLHPRPMTYPAAFRIAIVSLTFLLAGTVKGVTGMGLPTVAMGVLGAFMLPAEAAALLILPSFITN